MMKYLRYMRGGQFYVEVNDTTAYVAVPKNGVSIVEVDEKFFPFLLNKTCGCCGSITKCFREATVDEVKQWQGSA